MDIEARKRIITNYIRDHPDCKAEEIVEGISGKMSRALVFRYLPELIKEKIVLDNSKNRRDHKFSINNNNLILEVQDELDNFKKEFFQLIQKQKQLQKIKIILLFQMKLVYLQKNKKVGKCRLSKKYFSILSRNDRKIAKMSYRKNKSLFTKNILPYR